MVHARVIPCLLLSHDGLVKTIKFKDPKYVGDPINAIKIFNEKEVDELTVLDIDATREGKKPNLPLLKKLASECFMPMAYGGGITTLHDIRDVISIGVEKIIISTRAVEEPGFIKKAAQVYGSSTIVVCIDYKSTFLKGKKVTSRCGGKTSKYSPLEFAKLMGEMGAGEIILNAIDKDGTMAGYDWEEITKIANSVTTPVVALGGAGKTADLQKALAETNVSAVAAGSLFVFHGEQRAVLINYPDKDLFKKK
jgi:cyclase